MNHPLQLFTNTVESKKLLNINTLSTSSFDKLNFASIKLGIYKQFQNFPDHYRQVPYQLTPLSSAKLHTDPKILFNYQQFILAQTIQTTLSTLQKKIETNFTTESNLYFLTLTLNTTNPKKQFSAYQNKQCFMKDYAYDRKKCNLEIEYKVRGRIQQGKFHTFTKIPIETATRLSSKKTYNRNNPDNPTTFLGALDLIDEFLDKIKTLWRISNFKYVIIPELQKRGVWHFHILCTNPFPNVVNNSHNCRLPSGVKSCQDCQFALNHIWPHGYVNVQKIKDSSKIPLTYLKKYLTKQLQLKLTNPEKAKLHGLTKGISNYIFFRTTHIYGFLPQEERTSKQLQLFNLKNQISEIKYDLKSLKSENLEAYKTQLKHKILPLQTIAKKLNLEINLPQKIKTIKVENHPIRSSSTILKKQPLIKTTHNYFTHSKTDDSINLTPNKQTSNFFTFYENYLLLHKSLSLPSALSKYLKSNPFPIPFEIKTHDSTTFTPPQYEDYLNFEVLFYLCIDLSDRQSYFNQTWTRACKDFKCIWSNPNPSCDNKTHDPRAQFIFTEPKNRKIYNLFLKPFLTLIETKFRPSALIKYEDHKPSFQDYINWSEFSSIPYNLHNCPCYPYSESKKVIKTTHEGHCIGKQLYNFYLKHLAATDIYPRKLITWTGPSAEEASKRYADQDLLSEDEMLQNSTFPSLKAFYDRWPDLKPAAQNSYQDTPEFRLSEKLFQEDKHGRILIQKHNFMSVEKFNQLSPDEKRIVLKKVLEIDSRHPFPRQIPYLRKLWSLEELYNTNPKLFHELSLQPAYKYFSQNPDINQSQPIPTEPTQPKTSLTKDEIEEAISNLRERLSIEYKENSDDTNYQNYLLNEIGHFKSLIPNNKPSIPTQPIQTFKLFGNADEILSPSKHLTNLQELQDAYDLLSLQTQSIIHKKYKDDFDRQQLQELQDLKLKISQHSQP